MKKRPQATTTLPRPGFTAAVVDNFTLAIGQARRRCLLARYVLETKDGAGHSLTDDELEDVAYAVAEALVTVDADLQHVDDLITQAWEEGRKGGGR